MRAAVLRGGDMLVADIPEPVPAAGQVLVRTLCCGICGSDLHYAKHAPHMVEMSKRKGQGDEVTEPGEDVILLREIRDQLRARG